MKKIMLGIFVVCLITATQIEMKAMAEKIRSNGSYAISLAKAAINNGYDMDIKNAVEMEAGLFGITCSTHDKEEGMGAYLERRKANLTDF